MRCDPHLRVTVQRLCVQDCIPRTVAGMWVNIGKPENSPTEMTPRDRPGLLEAGSDEDRKLNLRSGPTSGFPDWKQLDSQVGAVMGQVADQTVWVEQGGVGVEVWRLAVKEELKEGLACLFREASEAAAGRSQSLFGSCAVQTVGIGEQMALLAAASGSLAILGAGSGWHET
ncbi:hypothetical protein P7K49_020215 [Saguinus oedipus]|uniref:Uncharacterized protein n=1 Tax=Saguinus oedipus TaxID=9490 RepID=A0ABQ9V1E4_SAGOE|nr:hypothetical protein P7K49_020215 [Saguinus oedipus]